LHAIDAVAARMLCWQAKRSDAVYELEPQPDIKDPACEGEPAIINPGERVGLGRGLKEGGLSWSWNLRCLGAKACTPVPQAGLANGSLAPSPPTQVHTHHNPHRKSHMMLTMGLTHTYRL
jgi:hypothetical protein